jgi:hypothetical protein
MAKTKTTKRSETDTASRHVIQFHDLELRPELEARVDVSNSEQSVHLIARRDLERYYNLLSEGLRRVRSTDKDYNLTEAEASLIVDVLNGSVMDSTGAAMLWHEIEDGVRLDGLDIKWAIDGAVLVSRVRSWGLIDCMAIIDAAERFWGQHPDGETIHDGLVRVGLIRGK